MIIRTTADLSLDKVMKEHGSWFDENFPKPELLKNLTKLTEELGELNGAIYRNNPEAMLDALGDVFIAWLGMCRCMDIHPASVAMDEWDKVKYRNYKQFPVNGRSE
jgi:NTP pyrophosphatase (non-canonical NTP hydrolase)